MEIKNRIRTVLLFDIMLILARTKLLVSSLLQIYSRF